MVWAEFGSTSNTWFVTSRKIHYFRDGGGGTILKGLGENAALLPMYMYIVYLYMFA